LGTEEGNPGAQATSLVTADDHARQRVNESLKSLANHDVDLIFRDISMPRENGFEFAKRLRVSGRC
jgi:two-component SAPR family response regulator